MSQSTDLVFDCAVLLNLIPEYAFGLTDPEQTRWVEANLTRCPEAVAQLEDFQRLQSEMRAAVPQIDPAPRVGVRLMAALAAPVPVIVPAPKTRRVPRTAWWIALVAVLALVITNVYWLTRVADLTQSQDLLTALLNTQTNAFVLTNTDALHWVRLADPQQVNNASAFMMWNNQSKTGLLYARGFPALPAGQSYQLWLTQGSEKTAVGILTINADGDGALLFSSPVPINHYTWARITVEAETGTNPAATSEPVVTGALNPT